MVVGTPVMQNGRHPLQDTAIHLTAIKPADACNATHRIPFLTLGFSR
jgi:hypothetical protein